MNFSQKTPLYFFYTMVKKVKNDQKVMVSGHRGGRGGVGVGGGGEIDDRRRLLSSVLAGGERVGKGEYRSRTTCPNSKDEEETIIHAGIRIQTITSPRAEASPAECAMHAPAHAVVSHTQSILLCSTATSPSNSGQSFHKYSSIFESCPDRH